MRREKDGVDGGCQGAHTWRLRGEAGLTLDPKSFRGYEEEGHLQRKKDRSIVPEAETCLRGSLAGELKLGEHTRWPSCQEEPLLSPADTCTAPETTSTWTCSRPSSCERCLSSSGTRSSSGCTARPPSSTSGTGSSPTRCVARSGRAWGGWHGQ